MAAPTSRTKRRTRGVSLVELMVGMAVALFIVAGAAMLASVQMGESRRLLLDTQMQQELRAATDLMLRELRRAGHWGSAERGMRTEDGAAGLPNPYAGTTPSQDGSTGSEITFVHSRDAVENQVIDSADRSGFRLRAGVIEMLIGGGGWQALTDPATLSVTRFEVTLRQTPVPLPCARACAAGVADCPPVQTLRDVSVRIVAQAVHDARVQRSLQGQAHLRNDLVQGRCPEI